MQKCNAKVGVFFRGVKMKIYIAGKITGFSRKEYCEKFSITQHLLQAEGHLVMNPAFVNATDGFEHEDYMHVCYAMIDVCEAVYMQKDWRESKGARLELQYAADHKKKIIYEDGLSREEDFPIVYGHPKSLNTEEKILESVRASCKMGGYPFLCIVGEKSDWSCESNSHIGRVAEFHKEAE